MERQHWPVIIIGGGTFGISVAWQLAERGVESLVFEQFDLVNDLASHGGHTRVIRHAYAEGEGYIPLVLRADELFLELEQRLNTPILHRTGSLEIESDGHSHSSRARASAEAAGIPYETMDTISIAARWPAFQLPSNWTAGFDPNAGFLEVEPALRGMAKLAGDQGAIFKTGARISNWGSDGLIAWVEADGQRFTSDQLIITGGAWMPDLIGPGTIPVEIYRKVLFWLEVDNPERLAPGKIPVFLVDCQQWGEIYGFPVAGQQPGLKIARHDGGDLTTADLLDRAVYPGEEADVVGLAQTLFTGVTGRVLESKVCMYSRTPDGHFIIDRHPNHPNVVIAAGFSGHGFKFAPAVGELLADLAIDSGRETLPLFRLDRFETS